MLRQVLERFLEAEGIEGKGLKLRDRQPVEAQGVADLVLRVKGARLCVSNEPAGADSRKYSPSSCQASLASRKKFSTTPSVDTAREENSTLSMQNRMNSGMRSGD